MHVAEYEKLETGRTIVQRELKRRGVIGTGGWKFDCLDLAVDGCDLDKFAARVNDHSYSLVEHDDMTNTVMCEVSRSELLDRLRDLLATLTPNERDVITMRFGLKDGYSLTLEDTGKKMGLWRERVRQIGAKAIRKFRHPTRLRRLEGFIVR